MKIDFKDLVVIDIETVPAYQNYEQLDEVSAVFWNAKSKLISPLTPEESYQKAGIYAEFGKIVCISIGMFFKVNRKTKFKVTSFAHVSEIEVLKQFIGFLSRMPKNMRFAGHNVREFDIPFICRRLLINQFEIPAQLDFMAKKPWENPLVDTLHLWRFGDYKHYTSLALLAHIFNLPSPKVDLDGSMVSTFFYQKMDGLQAIATYCKNDVITCARLLQRLNGSVPVLDEDIVHV